MDLEKYKALLTKAVKTFWQTQDSQKNAAQTEKEIKDIGNRSAVTGGKQLNGFLQLLYIVATDIGIPEQCIYIKGNQLLGCFGPRKFGTCSSSR